jgi:hypothetical protein
LLFLSSEKEMSDIEEGGEHSGDQVALDEDVSEEPAHPGPQKLSTPKQKEIRPKKKDRKMLLLEKAEEMRVSAKSTADRLESINAERVRRDVLKEERRKEREADQERRHAEKLGALDKFVVQLAAISSTLQTINEKTVVEPWKPVKKNGRK